MKYKHNLKVAAPVTSKRYVTRKNNAFEGANKASDIDLSETGTEGNYLLLELDKLKRLKVDKKMYIFVEGKEMESKIKRRH